jgi:preprotein translocase subunit YajC
MFHTLVLLAEDPKPSAPFGFDMLLPVGILVLLYFIVLRPMRRQDQERNSLAKSLKKNDDVLTTSGIYGTIVNVSEKEDEVTVKVADNVRLRMLKSSIARNLTNEEALKNQKAAKDSGKTS